MLSQLKNWIMRELAVSCGSQWFSFKLIYFDGTIYDGWINSWFTYVHKSILVIM